MTSSHTSIKNGSREPDTNINELGWSSFYQKQLEGMEGMDSAVFPARVIGVRRNSFLVSQGYEQLLVTLAGSLMNKPGTLYPAVGDWVLIRESLIITIFSRKNALTRKVSGGKNRKDGEASVQDQVIAVNLDKVFIVCGLDRDFNLRRIERHLTMIYNSGITPEVILTKADLHKKPEAYLDELESVAFGVPVYMVSAEGEATITQLRANLCFGETVAMIGSSGAGKSTLINRLYGEEIRATGSVSTRIGKGKHTTTSRDLITLPTGGMLIDNPGIREIALGACSSESLSAFPEIDELSFSCKFQDCSHTHEPGCKVIEAVSSGNIPPERLQSYHKIQSELRYTSERQQKSAARVERDRWKWVSQKVKDIKKKK